VAECLHSQPQSEVECAALARLTLHPYSSPIIFTSFAQIANPNPCRHTCESWSRRLENASKIFSCLSIGILCQCLYGEMQAGDSAIVHSSFTLTKTPPRSVNLMALPTILTRIWRILPDRRAAPQERLALLRS